MGLKFSRTQHNLSQVQTIISVIERLDLSSEDLQQANAFGWNLVDEAVMLGHEDAAAELFHRGAKETDSLRQSKQARLEVLQKALRQLEVLEVSGRLDERVNVRQLEKDIGVQAVITVIQRMIHNVEKTSKCLYR